MAVTHLPSIFGAILKLTFLAGAALYAGLVFMNYRTGSSHLRPPVDRRDPARSFERLAVWLGVTVLTLVVRAAARFFGMLSEASAEVGDWFLGHHHPEAH